MAESEHKGLAQIAPEELESFRRAVRETDINRVNEILTAHPAPERGLRSHLEKFRFDFIADLPPPPHSGDQSSSTQTER